MVPGPIPSQRISRKSHRMISFEATPKERVHIDTSHDVLIQHEHARASSYAGLKGSFTAVGCVFEQCDFTAMRPRQFSFAGGKEPTKYVECAFDRSKLTRIIAGQARFERCSFLDVELKGFLGHQTEFVDCVFSGVLRESVFYGRVFDQSKTSRKVNEFRGNDFSKTRFVDVGFRQGVDLSLQQLPKGEDYVYLRDADRVLRDLRQMYLQKPASALRQEVFRFLQVPEEEIRAGQKQLFLCKSSERTHLGDATIDTIWRDLRHLIGSDAKT